MSQTSGVATISAFQLILRVLRNIKVVQECLGVINCPLAYWQQGLAGTHRFFSHRIRLAFLLLTCRFIYKKPI